MNENYSNRELDRMFEEIKVKLSDQDRVLARIEEQTRKTNGSVSMLKAWRTGLSMCLGLVIFVIIPLLIYSFQLSEQNLKQSTLLQIQHLQLNQLK